MARGNPRRSGGATKASPQKQGSFKYTWEGATVLAEIQARIQSAMDRTAEELAIYLYENLHRYPYKDLNKPHRLAEEAFSFVQIRGGKRTIVAGSDAEFTVYHELGTGWTPAHPQIRAAIDKFAPLLTQRIRATLAR